MARMVPSEARDTGSSAEFKVFGLIQMETGQAGDWNWSCARRGGLGEKLKSETGPVALRRQGLLTDASVR